VGYAGRLEARARGWEGRRGKRNATSRMHADMQLKQMHDGIYCVCTMVSFAIAVGVKIVEKSSMEVASAWQVMRWR
jgi:hypothetical protein